MAPQTPAQLSLLAEQIQLSLLERQRNRSLNLDTTSQTAAITASLATLHAGIAALQAAGSTATTALETQHANLLADTEDRPRPSAISPPASPPPAPPASKSVRFRDDDDAEDPARGALFAQAGAPYTDDPDAQPYTDDSVDNVQLHAQHTQTLRDQDAELDTLGASVRRQRLLGISIGSELDEQAELMEDVEAGVDRTASALDRGRERLGRFARKASGNWSWVTIGVLSVILLILIIVR